ncbi:hypothetical protein FN846DRAFT_892902 [Sphaerosporella brunnea]|uniref:Uncharacterized protein n=1 Tax=Sphaerosporella brunnea TaxID=1250544 RepID=A0A5J5EN29_9PEZI|nr:hypothetical protein FN846DRAFT_892902 [Sphaerosporella brunnea]
MAPPRRPRDDDNDTSSDEAGPSGGDTSSDEAGPRDGDTSSDEAGPGGGDTSSDEADPHELCCRIKGLSIDAFAHIPALRDSPFVTALLANFTRAVDTLKDPAFWRALYHTITEYIKQHPWQTAAILLGIVLILNPVALAGFGAGGVVGGSIAAGIQAGMGGYIAAGSAFAILQSVGVLGAVAIPMTGLGVLGCGGGGAESHRVAQEWFQKG